MTPCSIYPTTERIWSIAGAGFSLTDAISVDIDEDEDGLVGRIDDLGLYAFGESIPQIMAELQADIVDLYEDLSEVPDDTLGSRPRAWKQYLLVHTVADGPGE